MTEPCLVCTVVCWKPCSGPELWLVVFVAHLNDLLVDLKFFWNIVMITMLGDTSIFMARHYEFLLT